MKKVLAAVLLATLSTLGAANSTAPSTAAAAKKSEIMARGQQIAGTVCVACHGLDGMSAVPANPNIAGMPAQYIAKQLALFKEGKRSNAIMQGMVANLSDADMKALGEYYFAQKAGINAVARDKALAEKGQTIYRAGIPSANVPACAGCHGAAGAGIPANYPRLAGQWPEYTFEELENYASGARRHAVMGAIAARMREPEMRAVAEYIAGMRSK